MRFLNLVGNSFGCSASGERLVSAAREGDFQEAKALLDYNPRLARYSTFGARNSPLHYSSAQGHNEIVGLLLEFGVDINLRNYRGQTALMQACQYGHWEVVQTLILFKANTHKADYLNGGTALHLAALNGHSRCIRLLIADYVPSIPNFFSGSKNSESVSELDEGYLAALHEVINKPADGGVTALHMAALNGHVEAVQLLLDLGSSVSNKTIEDGTTIDLIGGGSTPLHYAACGGNAQCCQLLIARGASLTTANVSGCTPLMVARSWHRDWLADVLNQTPESQIRRSNPSPYLCLPLRSIVDIARQCGWRSSDSLSSCLDPCVVCLERKCTVAAEGCFHEFCTRCALYLCSTNTTSATNHAPTGSIACPLCRSGIVSFTKLASTKVKEIARSTSLSLPFCSRSVEDHEFSSLETPFCKPDINCGRITPMGSLRSLSCQRFSPSLLCLGGSEATKTGDSGLKNELVRCSRLSIRRSRSQNEGRRWLCSFSPSMETERIC